LIRVAELRGSASQVESSAGPTYAAAELKSNNNGGISLGIDHNRRPLTSRSTGWARFLSNALVRSGISANAISVASLVFAAMGAAALLTCPAPTGLIVTAACVQLRLLCNLLDGMVAIEGGRQSPLGGLYNELPDRIADSFFIVALGYAVDLAWLGWFGALAAAVTAYIRVLGGSLGLPQDFRGPQAKPHRMAVMTVGCLIGAIEVLIWQTQYALLAAAWIIGGGAALTCVTRTAAIAKQLNARTS
jgi:phosphatidylglycerophosphate synthase